MTYDVLILKTLNLVLNLLSFYRAHLHSIPNSVPPEVIHLYQSLHPGLPCTPHPLYMEYRVHHLWSVHTVVHIMVGLYGAPLYLFSCVNSSSSSMYVGVHIPTGWADEKASSKPLSTRQSPTVSVDTQREI